MKKIFFLTIFLIGNFLFANDHFEFLNDYTDIFIRMDKGTIEFENTLQNNSNINDLSISIKKYNDLIVLYSLNNFLKYAESENPEIKEISNYISITLADLVRNNSDFLDLISNTTLSEQEITEHATKLIQKNKFSTENFNEIAILLINAISKENTTSNKRTQYLKISFKEKSTISKKIRSTYKKSVERGLRQTIRDTNTTFFEKSLLLIYDYFEIETKWKFNN